MSIRDFFARFRKKRPAPIEPKRSSPSEDAASVVLPWLRGRRTIYEHLKQYADLESPLPPEAVRLPDEAEQRARNPVPWAAGAIDGILGVQKNASQKAAEIYALLERAAKHPYFEPVLALHDRLTEDDYFEYVDDLVDLVVDSGKITAEELEPIALILAIDSPDRKPVKLGIVLLGLFQSWKYTHIFWVLAAHEEFSLYAIVALLRTLPPEISEEYVWGLAKKLEGWGRIHAVRRLLRTERPEIKDWLIREGFRNSILYAYLACDCAIAGELAKVLQNQEIDDALFTSAGDILWTLCRVDGPAEDMTGYEDGTAAVESWLLHLAKRAPSDARHLLVADAIRSFASDDELGAPGWNAAFRKEVIKTVDTVFGRPAWKEFVALALERVESDDFRAVASAADIMGMDTWEARFRRQQTSDDSQWTELLATQDSGRVQRALALAENTLDLNALSAGAADDFSHELAWKHTVLSLLLRALEAHPAEGWNFIFIGLKNPSVRNRRATLALLEERGSDAWPEDVIPALRAAAAVEPDEELQKTMQRLLDAAPHGARSTLV